MARTRKKNLYFTKVHEQAIIDYCLTKDMKIRNELYNTYIGPAFDEMVDKISMIRIGVPKPFHILVL